jgi:hypothetical protein
VTFFRANIGLDSAEMWGIVSYSSKSMFQERNNHPAENSGDIRPNWQLRNETAIIRSSKEYTTQTVFSVERWGIDVLLVNIRCSKEFVNHQVDVIRIVRIVTQLLAIIRCSKECVNHQVDVIRILRIVTQRDEYMPKGT